MLSEKMKDLINEFVDNEIDNSKIEFLFEYLAQDSEAREYYKSLKLLSNNTLQSKEDLSRDVENNIIYSIRDIENSAKSNWFDIKNIISYGFSVILIVLSVYFFSLFNSFNDQLSAAKYNLNQQQQIIQSMYNSLPTINIESKYENEIIINSNL